MYAQLLSAAIGVWLMAAASVLGYEGAAATNDRIIGPVIASFGLIAATEVTRGVRFANLPLAVWLLIAPWILGFGTAATINSSFAGVLVALLSLVGGKVKHRYNGGWSALWKRGSLLR